MENLATDNAVFDLIELNAISSYFIGNAKSPAIVICAGAFSIKGKYTLFFGRGIDAEGFSSLKKAQYRAKEMLNKPALHDLSIIHKKYGRIVERFIARKVNEKNGRNR